MLRVLLVLVILRETQPECYGEIFIENGFSLVIENMPMCRWKVTADEGKHFKGYICSKLEIQVFNGPCE